MLFDDVSFHASQILEVKEECYEQSMDFLMDFPINWEDNQFEKKILRFKNVVLYIKKEIPFAGYPTILDIQIKQTGKHTYNASTSTVAASPYKIEMITNAGSRFIEFSDVYLLGVQTV